MNDELGEHWDKAFEEGRKSGIKTAIRALQYLLGEDEE